MQHAIESIVDGYDRGLLTRRQLIGHLVAVATAMSGTAVASQSGSQKSTFTATGLDHIALSVTDVARSRAFYEKHLGLKVMRDGGEQSCFLHCGDNFVALFRSKEPAMHHYCYAIDDYEPDTAVEKLQAAGLTVRRAQNRVYFDDPDGLEVQVAAAHAGSTTTMP